MLGRPTACSASETEESGKQLCSTWHVLGINIEAMFFMPPPRVWMEVGKKVDRSRSLGCTGRFCERVTQLQKELNRTQDELRSTKQALNATNEELARLKAASNSASATAPAPVNVAEVKPDSGAATSGNSTAAGQRPVVSSMPADRSVAIQWPDSGRAPVSANQNPGANPGSSATGVSSQQAGRSGSGGASNRTVVIQWPNNNGAPPSTNQPSAPSSAPNPPARAVQQPASGATGRSDRTVIIQWPDSGQSPPPRN